MTIRKKTLLYSTVALATLSILGLTACSMLTTTHKTKLEISVKCPDAKQTKKLPEILLAKVK